MFASVIIIGKQSNHDACAGDLNVAGPTLKCRRDGIVATFDLGAMRSKVWNKPNFPPHKSCGQEEDEGD